MKKLTGIILAGAMALSMGTQAFAAGTDNGNHYGWENGKHNPHKSEVTPPEVDIQNPTENTVSLAKINAIVYDLNHAENQYSTINARYENGWIKMDNFNFNLAASNWNWSIINKVLDNHNVKVVDYTVENVVWDCPDGDCTGHWGTVAIKVEKQ